MNPQDLLRELGNHIGLGPLRFDDSGVCRLVFDGDVSVDIEEDSDQSHSLLMHSVVGNTPPDGRLAFYGKLLSGNYLGTQTRGGSLALDPSTGEVLLWCSLDTAQMDIEVFAKKLTDFVQGVRSWSGELMRDHESDTSSFDAESLSVAGFMRV